MFSIEVTDDRTEFDRLDLALQGFDGLVVEAGIFDAENATKAAANEHGTHHIPARPVFVTTADAARERIGGRAATAVRAVIGHRKEAAEAWEVVGETMAKSMRSAVKRNKAGGPPLAASTIERKGHKRKLVDSGDMAAAIDTEVSRER